MKVEPRLQGPDPSISEAVIKRRRKLRGEGIREGRIVIVAVITNVYSNYIGIMVFHI
jgi:hypothetical protein